MTEPSFEVGHQRALWELALLHRGAEKGLRRGVGRDRNYAIGRRHAANNIGPPGSRA